jgi:L-ascorbate metabolism protein UlaG (beta-lactamase superfamily)
MGALVLAVGMVVMSAAGDAEVEVRALFAKWATAVEQHDLAAAAVLYSDGIISEGESKEDAVLAKTRFLWRERFGGSRIERDGYVVSVDGDSASVSPITALTPFTGEQVELLLRKEASGWRITDLVYSNEVPAESLLPGLGQAYVARTDAWAGEILTWIQKTLWENPPNGGDRILRMQALGALDEPLHLRSATMLPSVKSFLYKNIDRAIAQMQSEKVTEGATIWKLYNHGFVVRTAEHTWAYDLYDGPEPLSMSESQMDAIVDQVDALFCSHWHRDHTARRPIQRATLKQKPVLVTALPDSHWRDQLDADWANGGYGDTKYIQILEHGASGVANGVPYRAYPGHQGLTFLNHVFAIESAGMTFIQTGDQYNDADFEWIDRIGDERKVDVLMPNVWTKDFKRMVEGVRPRYVIPGHENELGHNFEHREPYSQAFEWLGQVEPDFYVMAWGERVHIVPR